MFSLTFLLASVVSLMTVSTVNAANVGDGTFYAPGTGACGIFNTAADSIVAVSEAYFNSYPGATANPNLNPVCGKQISITYNGVTVPATITDKCGGCAGEFDLDMSPAVFDQLASELVGRITGVSWDFV
ncbi:hypothetical protein PLICRDRAFT_35086 [Plicaturopsis crispa FD-325 SS-3]|nr:hypothetical protein PLICRDRAFT_35086 [Plicaturopsis crispa FD-325 SS-3]